MKKLKLVIRDLHHAERRLARQLWRLADRHQADHEIHHVARDLARWSQRHVRELARVGRRHGVRLAADADGDGEVGHPAGASARRRASRMVGRRSAPAILLLADLRRLYRDASTVSLDWELLAQAAQAARQPDLLALATSCHPDTLRQARWANAKLKELAGQALVGR